MNRKLCVVTGSRADFGLLRWLMTDIAAHPDCTLQVIATGAHLSGELGGTRQDILDSGFTVDADVNAAPTDDSADAICQAVGQSLLAWPAAYRALNPDLVVLLGDRYEIFAAASAALLCGYPIAHLMGGERSEGAIDEALRHAISKMASLHFVANAVYRARVIQLGEQPERVFAVGGMGVDGLHRCPRLDRAALEAALGVPLWAKNLLITFHPVTLSSAAPLDQMQTLLAALDTLQDTRLIFTFPNADAGHAALISAIRSFTASHTNAVLFPSLGQQRYVSLLQQVDAVVGNSSSGLAEAPSFGLPTLNIGERQDGRLKAESVLDCPVDRAAILDGIHACYDPAIRDRASRCRNPYGEPGAARRILEHLLAVPLSGLRGKRFYDLPGSLAQTEGGRP